MSGAPAAIEIERYERRDLDGIVALHAAESWPSFPEDPARAHRAVTAPGVIAVVARDQEGAVVGFAYLQSDGEIQAHLSNIVVAATHRRQGIARRLLTRALDDAGGLRIDLLTDTAGPFYTSLRHVRMEGYRLYPPFT